MQIRKTMLIRDRIETDELDAPCDRMIRVPVRTVRPKLAGFCSALMAGFCSAVDNSNDPRQMPSGEGFHMGQFSVTSNNPSIPSKGSRVNPGDKMDSGNGWVI